MTCGTCKRNLPVDQFHWKNRAAGIRVTTCKSCRSAYNKKWEELQGPERIRRIYESNKRTRNRRSNMINAIKTEAGCADCGERDPIVLDFDHLGDKKFAIAKGVGMGVSLVRLRAELAKCEVVCANCHRRRTHARRASGAGHACLS